MDKGIRLHALKLIIEVADIAENIMINAPDDRIDNVVGVFNNIMAQESRKRWATLIHVFNIASEEERESVRSIISDFKTYIDSIYRAKSVREIESAVIPSSIVDIQPLYLAATVFSDVMMEKVAEKSNKRYIHRGKVFSSLAWMAVGTNIKEDRSKSSSQYSIIYLYAASTPWKKKKMAEVGELIPIDDILDHTSYKKDDLISRASMPPSAFSRVVISIPESTISYEYDTLADRYTQIKEAYDRAVQSIIDEYVNDDYIKRFTLVFFSNPQDLKAYDNFKRSFSTFISDVSLGDDLRDKIKASLKLVNEKIKSSIKEKLDEIVPPLISDYTPYDYEVELEGKDTISIDSDIIPIESFPYLGRKKTVMDLINSMIPDKNYKVFIDPFVGSGAVIERLKFVPKIAIINDLNTYVYDIHNAIISGEINEKSLKQKYNEIKDKYSHLFAMNDKERKYSDIVPVINAIVYGDSDVNTIFILLHASPRIVRGGNQFRRIPSLKTVIKNYRDLKDAYDKIDEIYTYNVDAIKLLNDLHDKYDSNDVLIYLDPPYFKMKMANKHYVSDIDYDKFIDAILQYKNATIVMTNSDAILKHPKINKDEWKVKRYNHPIAGKYKRKYKEVILVRPTG